MVLIAFCGKAGAGKDTAADYLVRHFRFHRIGFADQLYKEVAEGFGVTVDWLQDRGRKEREQPELALKRCRQVSFVELVRTLYPGIDLETPLSPRRVLQMWGSDWRRRQDPQYFVKHVQNQIHQILRQRPNARIAISDVRLPIEASMLVDEGGTLFLIERPPTAYSIAPEAMTHETEQTANLRPYIDGVLQNDGDLERFHQIVAAAVLPHLKRHRNRLTVSM